MNVHRLRLNIDIGQRGRVLCVDDDPVSLSLLSLILQQHGYEVLTSSNPILAIEVLRQEAVDVALLDYEMLLMKGGELAALLKRDGLAAKVILFSGSLEITQHDLAFVDLLVHKSEGVAALLKAIESVLPARKRALTDVQPH